MFAHSEVILRSGISGLIDYGMIEVPAPRICCGVCADILKDHVGSLIY